jgi:hypothetical protein
VQRDSLISIVPVFEYDPVRARDALLLLLERRAARNREATEGESVAGEDRDAPRSS